MAFKRFSLLIIARAFFAMITLVLLTLAIVTPGYHATTILLSAIITGQFVELMRFVKKTNEELVRFLDAIRHSDYSQRFELSNVGSGFEELGQTLSEILARFQEKKSDKEKHIKHLKAVVEHVPVPLISLTQHNNLTLLNHSARKLFGTHAVTKLDDLTRFSESFPVLIKAMNAGEKQLIDIHIDGLKHQLSVQATEIMIGQQKETLLSLQDIKSELNHTQLQAWQDLVRVLTHEIMNSITPVASLAKTAVDLVDDVKSQMLDHPHLTDELSDVSDAVSTVARRSDSLMSFVSSYRQLTRLPPPNKKLILVKELFNQALILSTSNEQQKHISTDYQIVPESLDINVDKAMLEQVLINLLKNAEHAVEGQPDAAIHLKAYINKRGYPVIELKDNGCGMTDEIAKNVFVPFYTTKRDGSGVGLALTRQIMLAHNGDISIESTPENGCTVRLTF